MNGKKQFVPDNQAGVIAKGVQMHGGLSGPGVVPANYGLTAQDVTDLGTILTAAQGAVSVRDAAAEEKKSKTGTLSGPGGLLDQLVSTIRDVGNKVRVSSATDAMAQAVGVDRRSPTRTPRTIPGDAPEFTLESVQPGLINVRFRTAGSAAPRARTANATGAQIAVVDAADPVADGEADGATIRYVPRSPATMTSTGMPAKVRLYARWQTQRGLVSGWSLPLLVTVL
jgi:hypothetical protein